MIRFKLLGQARSAAGADSCALAFESAATLHDAFAALSEKYGDALRQVIQDDRGKPQPSIMIFLNDEQVPSNANCALNDGDTVTIMPPISGG